MDEMLMNSVVEVFSKHFILFNYRPSKIYCD